MTEDSTDRMIDKVVDAIERRREEKKKIDAIVRLVLQRMSETQNQKTASKSEPPK